MRLLFVNSAWAESWGGGEKWTIEAADWFRAHGHETMVVCRPDSRLLRAAQERGLQGTATPFGGDFDPAAVLRARRIIRDFRPDLVVVNFNKEAWQFGLAAKISGKPVLARHGFPLFHKGIHHRALLTGVLTALVVNAASIREYYRTLRLPVDHVAVIHNGTSLVEQKPGELRRRFGIRSDELLVLASGRLESQKRFDRVIEIAAALLPDISNLRFLIAGDGPLKGVLEGSIRRRGLEDRVQLTGFLTNFAELAGDADLFLLTSGEEGTPNVLLEAMAAGVACLSISVGAVPEILSGGLAANVFAPGDVAAMTVRAKSLLQDGETRAGVAAEMQALAAAEFSTDVSMERFEDVFRKTTGAYR